MKQKLKEAIDKRDLEAVKELYNSLLTAKETEEFIEYFDYAFINDSHEIVLFCAQKTVAFFRKQGITAKDAITTGAHSGRTLLHIAALGGNEGAISELLAKGADIDAKTKIGDTPLIIVSATGNLKAVQLFIKAKAELNTINNSGNTALMYADI
ncbi:MAG: serine/threonine-protein phosphatase 6 regulatory ankyrin repeat subunit A-like [Rickettsiaceae bacterium]|jgi:ankyrin repeat protein|nr:serine/threonine-protein phosphatase 6 regulatory ankyrin repeat subunit A-like [Rickettsiaceae bacterium]